MSSKNCLVCHNETNGKRHYGARVCRACAAFFRRAGVSKLTKVCKKKKSCDALKDGYFTCKYCRLQKCLKVGMSCESFQFERDGYQVAKIPMTMDTFFGKPNFIIFRASSGTLNKSKNYIDLQYLMDRAAKILEQGCETPILSGSKLGKLALGFRKIQDSIAYPDPEQVESYDREMALGLMEFDILSVTKWLTHFEDFQSLPRRLQLKMLEGIWHVWWKLGRLAHVARSIRAKLSEGLIRKLEKDHLFFAWDLKQIDMSWLSEYTVEELKFFLDIPTEVRLDSLTLSMLELQPSDVELSYMLGQLCFHYAGKRFQGEILRVADKFQEMLANDLHDYYTREMKHPHYASRVAQMMRINNQIQLDVYRSKQRADLAVVFDIFNVEVSHPEMFMDISRT